MLFAIKQIQCLKHFVVVYDNDEIVVYEQNTRNPLSVLKSPEKEEDDEGMGDNVELCFNPYNGKFLFKRKRFSFFHDECEIWNILDNVHVATFYMNSRFCSELTFSRLYPNLVAFCSNKDTEQYRVFIYDFELGEFVKIIPVDLSPDMIQFSKDGYLMLGFKDGKIAYYDIEIEKRLKRSFAGKLVEKKDVIKPFKELEIEGVSHGTMISNRENEEIIFYEESFDHPDNPKLIIVNTQMVDEFGRPCFKSFKNFYMYFLINKDLIAIEKQFGNDWVDIFDTESMKVRTTFEYSHELPMSLASAKFWNRFIIYQDGGEIKIVDVITNEKIRNITIPKNYCRKHLSFKIRKKRDNFTLGVSMGDSKIIFFDSRDNSWENFVAEQGRKIVDFGFLPDSEEDEDPFLKEKVDYLIKELDELKFNDESGQEDALPGTDESESGQGQAVGQKRFKKSIVILRFFGKSFLVYKSIF